MYWTVNIQGGPKRVNHAAVALNGAIYSFGGYCAGETQRVRPIDVYVLNPKTYRWKKIKPNFEYYEKVEIFTDNNNVDVVLTPSDIPMQRYGHSIVAYKNKAYLWGGRNDQFGDLNVLYEFDPGTLRWRRIICEGNRPSGRDGHSAAVFGDKMYIFGGYEDSLERFTRETYEFDFNHSRWQKLRTTGDLPIWRDFHSCCIYDEKMYVFGGRGDLRGDLNGKDEVYSTEVSLLDLKSLKWCQLVANGDKPCGRRSHTAWFYKDRMYIFGGYNSQVDQHYNDLYEFNPSNLKWRKIIAQGIPPSARRRHCSVLLGSRVFSFGGTTPNKDYSRELGGRLLDLADLHILDFDVSLKTLASLAVIKNKQQMVDALPATLKCELSWMSKQNTILRYDG